MCSLDSDPMNLCAAPAAPGLTSIDSQIGEVHHQSLSKATLHSLRENLGEQTHWQTSWKVVALPNCIPEPEPVTCKDPEKWVGNFDLSGLVDGPASQSLIRSRQGPRLTSFSNWVGEPNCIRSPRLKADRSSSASRWWKATNSWCFSISISCLLISKSVSRSQTY